MLTGRREQARRDADATTGDDAWYTGKGRYLGYEYADAIRLAPDQNPDRVFANMRRNGVDSMLDRYLD